METLEKLKKEREELINKVDSSKEHDTMYFYNLFNIQELDKEIKIKEREIKKRTEIRASKPPKIKKKTNSEALKDYEEQDKRDFDTFMKYCKMFLNIKYLGIKDRCCNPKSKDYTNYGKRGITLCQEWLNNRDLFYKWCYDNNITYKASSIDRIDSSKGYSPDNCRFVSKEFNTRFIHGKEREKYAHSSVNMYYKAGKKINFYTIKSRIKRGWKEEDIINRPTKEMKITLSFLENMFSLHTNENSIKELFKRFKKDNKEDKLILEIGTKEYEEYIKNSCKCKDKIAYLKNK